MPGYGHVVVGDSGVGGMLWQADAALDLDMWVTAGSHDAVYKQYADATGHAPMLREDAMIFWQSRNRYKSSAIALGVAERYKALDLPVGVIVIDYKNQNHDGDFAPGPTCFPDVKVLSDGIRSAVNAATVFSFWPEVKTQAAEYTALKSAGCLINSALGGLAIDSTIGACRSKIWSEYLKPRYYNKGVTAYWLDETDGEGTAGGDVPGKDCNMRIEDCGGCKCPTAFLSLPFAAFPRCRLLFFFYISFADEASFGPVIAAIADQTSFGPAVAYSNLWVNQWLAMYTDPVTAIGQDLPLALTRSVWAGGQRHGIVLWSSDIESTFDELAAQVPQGVHASLSGIPWWTTDVGGYGCGKEFANESPYMKELIVRWYQFGCFCPIFRTHGHRMGKDEPDVGTCHPRQNSGGPNEVWSYGNDTQVTLSKYIRLRHDVLKPYIAELAANVSATGVPTMRPLWWEFPADAGSVGVNDQYMLGPKYLVAPVVTQGATTRKMYFPAGASWKQIFTQDVVAGGATKTVAAPLEQIPVYERV